MVEAVLEDVAVAGGGDAFVVLLKTSAGDYVPILIGHLEAMSILAGRADEPFPRPLAHDLMLSMLSLVGASLKRVEISQLVASEGGATFYAQVVLEHRGVELELDARPSDALALAVRTKAPLWVAQSVVEQVGLSELLEGGAEA